MEWIAEKYATTGGYVYTLDNPIRLIDQRGKRPSTSEAALISKHFYGGDDATTTRKDLRAFGWKIVKGVDKITKNINDVLLNSEFDTAYKAQLYKRTNHGHVEFCLCFSSQILM